MAEQSIRDKIIADMKSRLENMPADRTQFGRVFEEDWADFNLTSENVLTISEGIENYFENATVRLDRNLEIEWRVSVYVPRGEKPSAKVREVLRDLEYVATTHQRWSGWAMRTTPTANLRTVDDPNDRRVEVSFTMTVTYRTARTDASSIG